MSELSDTFVNGVHEIYSTFFSSVVYLSLLDTENTIVNIYKESKEKIYLAPVALVGKVALKSEDGTLPVEEQSTTAKITITAKSLLDNNISVAPEDLETLESAKMTYQDVDYSIVKVEPTVNINDVYLFYVFSCDEPKKREQ